METEREIAAIRERNARVELDKAWEVSGLRRLFIMAITYVSAMAFLYFIGAPDPHLGALIPTGGYLLSTLSLPTMRRLWERFRANDEVR